MKNTTKPPAINAMKESTRHKTMVEREGGQRGGEGGRGGGGEYLVEDDRRRKTKRRRLLLLLLFSTIVGKSFFLHLVGCRLAFQR